MHEYCAKIKKPPPFAPVQEGPKDEKKSSDKNKPEDVSTEEENQSIEKLFY